MNISLEKVDSLNAIINIEIQPEDYSGEIEKGLKSMQQRANFPGFRKGKAPMGMVRKIYGTQIRTDEVFKKLNSELFSYLETEKVQYLGEPLPNESKPDSNNWDVDGVFNFAFDLGLMPDAEVSIPKNNPLTSYQITISDSEIDKEVERLRKGQSSFQEREEVSDEDSVMGTFDYLTEGEEVPTQPRCFLPMYKMESAKAKKALLGKKPGDAVSIPTKGLFADAKTTSIYLSVPEEDLENLPKEIEFKITSISRMAPAEINQDFFDQIFGEGQVSSEEQMRERISNTLKSNAQGMANQDVLKDLREWLIDSNPMELPEEFLIRWLHAGQKKEKSMDEVRESFQKDKRYIVWEVIRTKLLGKHDVRVEGEELMAECRANVANRLIRAGYQFDEKQLDDVVARFMQDKEEIRKIHENLLEVKLLEAVKSELTIAESVIDSEAYFELKKA